MKKEIKVVYNQELNMWELYLLTKDGWELSYAYPIIRDEHGNDRVCDNVLVEINRCLDLGYKLVK